MAGRARCFAHVVTDAAGRPIETFGSSTTIPPGYGPSSLLSAYDIPANSGAPGTIIVIVDAYGYTNAASDLAVYRSTFGLPALPTCPSTFPKVAATTACFVKYNEAGARGPYPAQNTGWAQESALDLDMASALCPKCSVILVEANSDSFADLGATENTAAGLDAHVISNSYGGGESGSQPYNADYNHPGVAVTVATGDSGYGAEFPATSQFVTAVGGTTLKKSSTARGWSEAAWSGGGSGCSAIYAKPSWQSSLTLCANRLEADVSAIADPDTGVAVYGPGTRGSAWQVYGGTSVSTQVIAGIYGVNGGAVSYGSNPYSFPTPYQTSGTGWVLNDVTSGGNGSCGSTYLCTAGAGYDGPTGLGTPHGLTAF
jgi:subtilase family serine protease